MNSLLFLSSRRTKQIPTLSIRVPMSQAPTAHWTQPKYSCLSTKEPNVFIFYGSTSFHPFVLYLCSPNGWEYFLIIHTYLCWFQYFIQLIFSCYCRDQMSFISDVKLAAQILGLVILIITLILTLHRLLTINTVLLLMPKFFLAVTLLAAMALPTAAAKAIFKW